MISRASRDLHTVPAALIGLAAAVIVALTLLPAPAHAHDTLISTDPADGDTLEASPDDITLTFSADVLEVSPVVRISDESGETLSEITPSVEGPTATAELEEPLPAGTYTVEWRVVSSDGHPIEGTFDITVEQDTDAGAAADPAASDGGGQSSDGGEAASSDAGGAAQSDAGGAEQSSAASQEEPADQNGSMMPWLLGIVGVAVVGVAIAAFFTLRKRS
ncbi:copper resistance protein CopC [Brachybacterium sp. GCM10030252]|uniref:copper resistance CopC family protein n=1 Tax=Brachybacterium sp. GCM10030252 TaxID=3273380 RepID=UPI00361E8A1E